MDHLPTFPTLRAADDVPVAETTADVDEGALDYWRDHAGIVVLGLRNEAGGVLLMDSTHGW
jgi:hypothetical protein